MFASQSALAVRYAESLAKEATVRGLIGPREVPRLWERHLLNCVYPVERVPLNARVADVGSGAGLPGLVWAIARPDLHVTLIEPLRRRTVYLEKVVSELGLKVEVIRSRAEEVDRTFDFVTARAVAPLEKLARWCLPLVTTGGSLLALKGSSVADEVAAATDSLRRMGAVDISVDKYGPVDGGTTVVEVVLE